MKNNLIRKEILKNEQFLSKYATLDKQAIRLLEIKQDIRNNYSRDADRIVYSLSYLRYSDKTQVFSNVDNDHISKRMIHVQFVSRIARTIGRALSLNEDLIEAIALGHDIGHVPFGHLGESILNEISNDNKEGNFCHNVQSVRALMYVENGGKGCNLTVQTLDGILCHNGEKIEKKYCCINKTSSEFLKDYNNCYHTNSRNLLPMTLEGCVVRISDVIGYLGRDLEDALRLGIITKDIIPDNIVNKLSCTNRDIVNNIILDIINNSYNKNYIALSNDMYDVLNELKDFNYKHIYYKANNKNRIKEIKNMFITVFNYNLKCLNNNIKNTNIFEFLNEMNDDYRNNNTNARIVIDYIAGMTDGYFIKEYENIININGN
ncbi:MAG: HD domain-containing protein [bacterium]|nr:HD domain-containing protein [bacterium]